MTSYQSQVLKIWTTTVLFGHYLLEWCHSKFEPTHLMKISLWILESQVKAALMN